MSSRSSVLLWGQAVACTLVTVLGVAACGGSDATGLGELFDAGGSSSSSSSGASSSSSSGGASSSSSGSSGNPTDAGADADASPDGSSGPTLSVADATTAEGDIGSKTMAFNVTLSAPSALPITVVYSTSDGTATTSAAAAGGADYTLSASVLTFAPGDTTKQVLVPIHGDSTDEADETFTLTLSAPGNATLGKATATGTITNDDALPAITLDDVSLVEGNAGTKDAVFTATLTPASGRPVTVSYKTTDGTATSPADFTAVPPTTLTFAPGETQKTLTVPIVGDTVQESSESFRVDLSSPTNANLGRTFGLGTIGDDDAPGARTLSVTDVTVTEGTGGTKNMTFEVKLDAAASSVVTVDFATADGTAITGGSAGSGGADYVATAGTLTFAVGETSKTVNVTINGDALDELDETLKLVLSNATGATLGTTTVTGTITDDDAAPTISVANASKAEGQAGTSVLSFTVSLSGPSGRPISVAYATADGSGANGAKSTGNASQGGVDYTPAAGSVTFAPGATTQTIAVLVNGDTLNEADEELVVDLSGPTNATIATGSATGTITNDDALPILSIGGARVLEGNAGTSALQFTVRLRDLNGNPAPSGRSVTVDYATADGSGLNPATIANSDYVAANGTLTFPAGQDTQVIVVNVNGDTTEEGNEDLKVALAAPANAVLGAASSGIGLITNDDGSPIFINVADSSVAEGNGGNAQLQFTVSLSKPVPVGQTLTVDYATSSAAAGPTVAAVGVDYTATTGTLTFAAGESSKNIPVEVKGDTLDENDETFLVDLSNASDGSIQNGQATGTITDDDAMPSLSVSSPSANEGNGGEPASLTFKVSLSTASGRAVTVNFASADGTATAGQDYTATTGSVTFAPGETSKDVKVTLTGDSTFELDETLTMTLTGAVNATIATAQGTGTITNDDAKPTISINDVSQLEGTPPAVQSTPFNFTVSLSNPSYQSITVVYATHGVTTNASDYVEIPATVLTFAPGETTKVVSVVVKADKANEGNETFTVDLTTPTNATVAKASGLGTILNDD